jgi:ribosomal protein S4E
METDEIVTGDKVFITGGTNKGRAGWVEQIKTTALGKKATVLLVHPSIKGKDRISEWYSNLVFLSRKPDA